MFKDLRMWCADSIVEFRDSHPKLIHFLIVKMMIPSPKISASDENNHRLFKIYGKKHLEFRYKCIGLLPKIYKGRVFEAKGFDSIFEYAKKLAGLSEEQVRRVLNLEKKFDDKPVLKSLLENGEISVNKLARIASIATAENQEFLATQVRLLPQSAVETLVKDWKFQTAPDKCPEKRGDYRGSEPHDQKQEINGVLGLQKPLFEYESVRAHIPDETQTVRDKIILENLSVEVKQKLLDLKRKNIDINVLFLQFLSQRENEIMREKEKIAVELAEAGPTKSRYIPVKIKQLFKKEYGDKCSFNNCEKPSVNLHHAQRFSVAGFHDPRFMAPLCAEHHKIAHTVDVKFHEIRSAALSGV